MGVVGWEDALSAGVRRRASEQTMVAYLKLFSQKQHFRNSGRRQQVNAIGAEFNALYGRTIDALEGCLVLQPPSRRHSICNVHWPFVVTTAEELESPRKRRKSTADEFPDVHDQLPCCKSMSCSTCALQSSCTSVQRIADSQAVQ